MLNQIFFTMKWFKQILWININALNVSSKRNEEIRSETKMNLGRVTLQCWMHWKLVFNIKSETFMRLFLNSTHFVHQSNEQYKMVIKTEQSACYELNGTARYIFRMTVPTRTYLINSIGLGNGFEPSSSKILRRFRIWKLNWISSH